MNNKDYYTENIYQKITILVLMLIIILLSLYCCSQYQKINTLQDHCVSLESYLDETQLIVSKVSLNPAYEVNLDFPKYKKFLIIPIKHPKSGLKVKSFKE